MRAVLINERTDKGGVLGRPITPVTGMTSSLKGTFNAGTNIATMNMKGISNKLKLVNDALIGAAQNIEQADQTIEKIEETSGEINTASASLTGNYWTKWVNHSITDEFSNVQLIATSSALDRARERLLGETVDPYTISNGLILPRGFYLTPYFNNVSSVLPNTPVFSYDTNVSPFTDSYGVRLPDGGYTATISTVLPNQTYYYGNYVKGDYISTTVTRGVYIPCSPVTVTWAGGVGIWSKTYADKWRAGTRYLICGCAYDSDPATAEFISSQPPNPYQDIEYYMLNGKYYMIDYTAYQPYSLEVSNLIYDRYPDNLEASNNPAAITAFYDTMGRKYESTFIYSQGSDYYGYATQAPYRGRVDVERFPHYFVKTDRTMGGGGTIRDVLRINPYQTIFFMIASTYVTNPTYNLHTEFNVYNKNLLNIKPNQIGGRVITKTWVWRTTCNFNTGKYYSVQILGLCQGESMPRLLMERDCVTYNAGSDAKFKSLEQVIYNFNPEAYGDFLTSNNKGKITEIFATTFDGHTISYRPNLTMTPKYDYIETKYDKWYTGY